jgi:hypothetical protein
MSKMLITIAAAAALTFTAHVASADEAMPEPRSRDTAFALSAGGLGLSIGLVGVGATVHNSTIGGIGLLSSLITPSAGEIYAGKFFTLGLGLRVVSAAAGIAGLEEAFKCFLASSECQHNNGLAGVLIVGGTIGYASGILYDIATAGSAVDDYNRRHNLHVSPTVLPTASSGPAVGMAIGGTF